MSLYLCSLCHGRLSQTLRPSSYPCRCRRALFSWSSIILCDRTFSIRPPGELVDGLAGFHSARAPFPGRGSFLITLDRFVDVRDCALARGAAAPSQSESGASDTATVLGISPFRLPDLRRGCTLPALVSPMHVGICCRHRCRPRGAGKSDVPRATHPRHLTLRNFCTDPTPPEQATANEQRCVCRTPCCSGLVGIVHSPVAWLLHQRSFGDH